MSAPQVTAAWFAGSLQCFLVGMLTLLWSLWSLVSIVALDNQMKGLKQQAKCMSWRNYCTWKKTWFGWTKLMKHVGMTWHMHERCGLDDLFSLCCFFWAPVMQVVSWGDILKSWPESGMREQRRLHHQRSQNLDELSSNIWNYMKIDDEIIDHDMFIIIFGSNYCFLTVGSCLDLIIDFHISTRSRTESFVIFPLV